jgi:zinc carboxypeptidase
MSTLAELDELARILEQNASRFEARTLCEVTDGERRFPIHAVTLGNPSPDAPAVGFFGGVHGLERVGTQVLLSFLDSLAGRLGWDERVQRVASEVRLVFMPLVNPAGMSRNTRANANGVDLMRNAPVQSRERVAFMLGGQRLYELRAVPLGHLSRPAARGPRCRAAAPARSGAKAAEQACHLIRAQRRRDAQALAQGFLVQGRAVEVLDLHL